MIRIINALNLRISRLRLLLASGLTLLLVGCSSTPVINLTQLQIDQKSYAVGYATTIQTEQGVINKQYDVKQFAKGVNNWYRGKVNTPIKTIKAQLYNHLQDSDISAYRTGIVFAYDLQQNFKRLSDKCWQQIQTPSLTQGIYDAALDLKSGAIRSADDPYIVKGTDQLLKLCETSK